MSSCGKLCSAVYLLVTVCTLGRYWQVSQVHSHSEFKPGVLEDIETDIGIHVGLKSVNITLYGKDCALGLFALGVDDST